jgi:hypothetical protein
MDYDNRAFGGSTAGVVRLNTSTPKVSNSTQVFTSASNGTVNQTTSVSMESTGWLNAIGAYAFVNSPTQTTTITPRVKYTINPEGAWTGEGIPPLSGVVESPTVAGTNASLAATFNPSFPEVRMEAYTDQYSTVYNIAPYPVYGGSARLQCEIVTPEGGYPSAEFGFYSFFPSISFIQPQFAERYLTSS